MTVPLFLKDAYLAEAPAIVTAVTDEGGLVLDQSIFYATSGGQPGDSGRLVWAGGVTEIAAAVKGEQGAIILVPATPEALPPVGTAVVQHLDWTRRHRHMRVHTALHLLSVVIPLPVTGGQIASDKGRLDFKMPEPPQDRDAIDDALNRLVNADMRTSAHWITQEALDANPGLVKTLSVQPPRGAGKIRLIQIGEGDQVADLQPCGGTHVARTGEIGRLSLGKIENKGKQNRRVNIHLQ